MESRPERSPLQRILVHINDSPRSIDALHLAAGLAQAHGASLHALYAVNASTPGAFLSPEASSIAMGLVLEAEQTRRDTARQRVESAAAALAPPLTLTLPEGDAAELLLRASRTADLLVLPQHDPAQPDGVGAALAGRLLVGAGCPLLVVPYILQSDAGGGRSTPPCGQRVLLAWSGQRESARALRDALPLLRRAQAVEVLQFEQGAADEPGSETDPLAEVAAHLRRHGVAPRCTVRRSSAPTVLERMQRGWTPDAPVAEALLSHAADTGADLIVMGGYGHPRAWELALGGVTRTILQTMTVPVFLSH
jgi:nucleotide-binding universal stress UspA family protein